MDDCSFHKATTVSSRERRESDLQNYHITILKMSSSQQKNYKAYKDTGKYGPFTRKKN